MGKPWTKISGPSLALFLLAGCASDPVASPAAPTAQEQAAAEEQTWSTARNSKNPADVQRYLARYPEGKYASMAKLRLKLLARASQ